MGKEDQNILIPIPEFVENLVELTIKKCLPKLIEEHQRNCPVNDIKVDLYGNDRPGIKTDVHDLKKDVKKLKEDNKVTKQRFWDIAKPVIVALIVSLIFGLFAMYIQSKVLARVIENNNIKTISENK